MSVNVKSNSMYSEPIKLFTMIVYAVVNGVLTVKEWAINPNA